MFTNDSSSIPAVQRRFSPARAKLFALLQSRHPPHRTVDFDPIAPPFKRQYPLVSKASTSGRGKTADGLSAFPVIYSASSLTGIKFNTCLNENAWRIIMSKGGFMIHCDPFSKRLKEKNSSVYVLCEKCNFNLNTLTR